MPYQECQEPDCKKSCYITPGLQPLLGHGLCDEHLQKYLDKDLQAEPGTPLGACMLRCPNCGSTSMTIELNLGAPVPYDNVECHECNIKWDRAAFVTDHPECILSYDESKKATAERDRVDEILVSPEIKKDFEQAYSGKTVITLTEGQTADLREILRKHHSNPTVGLRPMPPPPTSLKDYHKKIDRINELETRLVEAQEAFDLVGKWLSAALDDLKVCDAMKADITKAFELRG